LDALQASVDEVFGSTPEFKKASDKERQTLYEPFVLLATLPLVGYSVAIEQNDAELLKTYQQIAGGGAPGQAGAGQVHRDGFDPSLMEETLGIEAPQPEKP